MTGKSWRSTEEWATWTIDHTKAIHCANSAMKDSSIMTSWFDIYGRNITSVTFVMPMESLTSFTGKRKPLKKVVTFKIYLVLPRK